MSSDLISKLFSKDVQDQTKAITGYGQFYEQGLGVRDMVFYGHFHSEKDLSEFMLDSFGEFFKDFIDLQPGFLTTESIKKNEHGEDLLVYANFIEQQCPKVVLDEVNNPRGHIRWHSVFHMNNS